MEKTERERLKKRYSSYFNNVRTIINEYDPVGLIASGAPIDEHDTLTERVLILLVNNEMDKVRQLLIDCYEWYGMGGEIKEEYKEKFNRKVDNTYQKLYEIYKEYRNSNE
ncbi:hypothetical protein [Paenibacillus sp. YIM B09110]|uniref:hypothetical protein n=1 Tax=Paenibacillus sp. YIM B09110 TaxID=3126102 RepID=UPI00301D2179